MINLTRTLQLVKGGMFDPDATWRSYLPEAENWQKTALLLTGPLIVVSALLGYLIGMLGSGASVFGFRPTLVSTLIGIVTGAIAVGVIAMLLSALSGMFGGKKSFGLGLAAASFAFIPGYVGQALGWLPWIGGFVALGLFVYALILLWRIIPLYLEVPDGKRAGHYILSLIATVVVMFLISMVLRPMLGPSITGMPDFSGADSGAGSSGFGGIVGEVMRQGELLEAAEEDRYEPPADGKLDEDQVQDFVRVVSRAAALMEENTERMQELAERAEQEEDLSFSEMREMMGGATQMMGLNTLELEVVKSAGGNWAEHEWVKSALRTAYIQKDINETVAHNYALYQEYEDELRPFIAR